MESILEHTVFIPCASNSTHVSLTLLESFFIEILDGDDTPSRAQWRCMDFMALSNNSMDITIWMQFCSLGAIWCSGLRRPLAYIYGPAYAQSVANSLTCLPPQAIQWWDGGTTVSNTITSYTIGPIVCPAAYTTFSTSVVSASSTSIICCPTYVLNSQLQLGLAAHK